MTTLKDQFHTIANWHNKITIAAGCTKECLKAKPLDALTKEELKAQQKNLLSIFDKIENDAMTAAQKVTELKTIIYKTAGPSMEAPNG